MIGIVAETGEGHIIRLQDEVQYFGTCTTSGNAISASFTGVAPYGYAFPDGTTYGTGTLTGTIVARSQIQSTAQFRTAGGSSTTSTLNLTFNSLYSIGSSLVTIAGNYRDPDTGAVINVNSNGVVFSQDAVTGCIVNGQVSIIDSRYNAYRVQYSFANCLGPYAGLNGTSASGLGLYDNTVNPVRVIIGVVNPTAHYSLVGIYPRI